MLSNRCRIHSSSFNATAFTSAACAATLTPLVAAAHVASVAYPRRCARGQPRVLVGQRRGRFEHRLAGQLGVVLVACDHGSPPRAPSAPRARNAFPPELFERTPPRSPPASSGRRRRRVGAAVERVPARLEHRRRRRRVGAAVHRPARLEHRRRRRRAGAAVERVPARLEHRRRRRRRWRRLYTAVPPASSTAVAAAARRRGTPRSRPIRAPSSPPPSSAAVGAFPPAPPRRRRQDTVAPAAGIADAAVGRPRAAPSPPPRCGDNFAPARAAKRVAERRGSTPCVRTSRDCRLDRRCLAKISRRKRRAVLPCREHLANVLRLHDGRFKPSLESNTTANAMVLTIFRVPDQV